jgi:hypothetical protein
MDGLLVFAGFKSCVTIAMDWRRFANLRMDSVNPQLIDDFESGDKSVYPFILEELDTFSTSAE